jgi:hypothetical protein
MARNEYYIPAGQEAFFAFSQEFVTAVQEYAADLNLTTAVVTALAAAQTAYETAWTALVEAPHDKANTVARETLLKGRTKAIADFYNQHIRYNPALTASIKTAITGGAPDENNTPFDVKDHEVGALITPDGPAQLRLTLYDLQTNAKKILPGMGGIVAKWAITPAALTDEALLAESELLTTAHHVMKFTNAQRGHWLTICFAWQSKTGEKGTFGPLLTAVIP